MTSNTPTIGQMIDRLTKLIQSSFKNDPTDPGLVISRPKPRKVYASIVRFNKPFGKDKYTALKTHNKTMRGALRDLIRQIKETE
jgi:hypothetical protein